MRQTFSVVLDIQLDPNFIQLIERENHVPVIPSHTMKIIQESLEKAIEIRQPYSSDVVVKLWDSEKIVEQIEFLSTIETNKSLFYQDSIKLVSDTSEEISEELTPFYLKNENILLGSQEALKLFTKYEAQKMRIFPLQIDHQSFTCAMTTKDTAIINKLHLHTGKKIVCVTAPLSIILQSIEKAYQTTIETADRNALLLSITK